MSPQPGQALEIAVLGGSGFIGTQLVRTLLASGHRVRIGDIAPSKAYPELRVDCDVRDVDRLTDFLKGSDVVFNLAALFRDDVQPASLYYDINSGGPRNVCVAAERLGVQRLVFTSSSSVYGFSDDEVDEDAPKLPRKDYGRSKLEAEGIMREWYQRAPGRTLAMVRPSVVYGPGNRGNVWEIMRQLARNPYVMIGSGNNRKSVAYVENVAAFHERMLSLPPGEYVFNYADAQLSMETLVRRIREWLGRESAPLVRVPYPLAYAVGLACDAASAVTGRRIPIGLNRIQKFCGTTRYSTARAAALGFRAPVNAEEALERTFRLEFGASTVAAHPGRVGA